MTEFKHITEWCKQYSERNGVKIFPQSAPVLPLLDDLMAALERLRGYHDNLVGIYNSLNERLTRMEEALIKDASSKKIIKVKNEVKK